MANEIKVAFLKELTDRYGLLRKLDQSQSLYEIGKGVARIYIRYSRVHNGNRTFYGLRDEDLQKLEGHPSIICFLWNSQTEPLLIPFSEYEDVFQSTSPAGDGQYKVQVYLDDEGTELYIAKAGRFNVEGHIGWSQLETLIDSSSLNSFPELSHPQIQTLLGAIGVAKGYDIWIPQGDRNKLDWSLTGHFNCRDTTLPAFESIKNVFQEVDVIWVQRGSSFPKALFEIEHSTPIYSALLRFNDIHLVAPNLQSRFSVVANDIRRDLFVRQINRPTSRMSGLSELCTFLEYVNVFGWHKRMVIQ